MLVKYGDEERAKETEFADWDGEKKAWAWRETLTVEVSFYSDITVSIQSTTKYDLWLASLSLTTKRVGEVSFPVAPPAPLRPSPTSRGWLVRGARQASQAPCSRPACVHARALL